MSADAVTMVRVLDWYDGLVLGIIECPTLPDLQVAGLIAWSPARQLRAFLCIPAAQEVRSLPASVTWSELLALVDVSIRAHEKATLIIVDNHECLRHVQSVSVESVFPPEIPVLFDAARALDEDRQQWLAAA